MWITIRYLLVFLNVAFNLQYTNFEALSNKIFNSYIFGITQFININKYVFNFFSQANPLQNSGPKSVGLLETEVGISQFVGTTPGFSGVIKARFSDFHVNEIDIDGNEVKLTDVTLPKRPKTGK